MRKCDLDSIFRKKNIILRLFSIWIELENSFRIRYNDFTGMLESYMSLYEGLRVSSAG